VALVTVTSVGYGDKYPVTAAGRAVAVVLMITGIALFGVVTASITSYFVEQDQDRRMEERVDEILTVLHRLEARFEASERHGPCASEQYSPSTAKQYSPSTAERQAPATSEPAPRSSPEPAPRSSRGPVPESEPEPVPAARLQMPSVPVLGEDRRR
jgi:hypothetical protein